MRLIKSLFTLSSLHLPPLLRYLCSVYLPRLNKLMFQMVMSRFSLLVVMRLKVFSSGEKFAFIKLHLHSRHFFLSKVYQRTKMMFSFEAHPSSLIHLIKLTLMNFVRRINFWKKNIFLPLLQWRETLMDSSWFQWRLSAKNYEKLRM